MPDDSSTRPERDRFAGPPLTAAATRAAFPLGGIGTGNVSIGARGELRDWGIRNAPSMGTSLPFSFFSTHTKDADEQRVSRVLEAQLQPPFESEHGFRPGTVAGRPRLRGARLRGEYNEFRAEDGRHGLLLTSSLLHPRSLVLPRGTGGAVMTIEDKDVT